MIGLGLYGVQQAEVVMRPWPEYRAECDRQEACEVTRQWAGESQPNLEAGREALGSLEGREKVARGQGDGLAGIRVGLTPPLAHTTGV